MRYLLLLLLLLLISCDKDSGRPYVSKPVMSGMLEHRDETYYIVFEVLLRKDGTIKKFPLVIGPSNYTNGKNFKGYSASGAEPKLEHRRYYGRDISSEVNNGAVVLVQGSKRPIRILEEQWPDRLITKNGKTRIKIKQEQVYRYVRELLTNKE